MTRHWHLSDSRQSLVLAAKNASLPEVVYWGARLPETEDLNTLAGANMTDVTGGMLDTNPPISLCPEAAQAFQGHPGLSARTTNGTVLRPLFRFVDDIRTADTLQITYRDTTLGLKLDLHLALDTTTRMIVAKTELESLEPIVLDWLAAPVLPAAGHASELIEFSGRWCSEFQTQRIAFSSGARVRDNRTGRTDHSGFPGLIVTAPGTTNALGEAWAFHYGWSGGHRMVAEELSDGRRQVQFGHASSSQKPGTKFTTASLFATYSDTGLNGCATSFQRHARERIVTATHDPRPVHYNCWEAVYFDHDLNELKDIATRAEQLGAERFVLDDGWFGNRDDDTSSLGDWTIDPRKYPDGLAPLIEHVTSLGMEFGIWFEPEMINEDSNLFRAHPDWVLGRPDQVRGRQQLVLDMSREDVQAYLFEHVAAILSNHDIGYIKWDHNRVLPTAEACQANGVYALLDRLRSQFPHVEIESCASGGGRIDFGILKHTQRVWLSDSNDALERQRIQHDAALFLPAVLTGSHVGPRRCHTSGRTIDMPMRAWTAAQRHMGFEMDPRELTQDEADILRDVTTWWKTNRNWMSKADILRLDSSDPAVIAEQQQCQTGERFFVFSAQMRSSNQILPRPLRLTQLDPIAKYRLSLKNRAEATRLSRGEPAIKKEDQTFSGQYLMNHGLTLPWSFPQTIWVIEGTKL